MAPAIQNKQIAYKKIQISIPNSDNISGRPIVGFPETCTSQILDLHQKYYSKGYLYTKSECNEKFMPNTEIVTAFADNIIANTNIATTKAISDFVDKKIVDLKKEIDIDDVSSKIAKINAAISTIEQGLIVVDPTPTKDSPNAVSSKGVFNALQGKANTAALTNFYTKTEIEKKLKDAAPDYDTAPINGSAKAITSGGVYTAIHSIDNTSSLHNYYTKADMNSMLNDKQNKLTFDSTPTDESQNPITSDAVYEALKAFAKTSEITPRLDTIEGKIKFDSTPISGSSKIVTSDGIYKTLQKYATVSSLTEAVKNLITTSSVDNKIAKVKKDLTLTFDETPTAGSSNPVTSKGIHQALNGFVTQHDIDTLLARKQDKINITNTYTEDNQTDPITAYAIEGRLDELETRITTGDFKKNLDTKINAKQNTLTFDQIPTKSSSNPVTSNGVFVYIDEQVKPNIMSTVQSEITSATSNLSNTVTGIINSSLETKQNKLTFDSSPTKNSNNPVTSDGIKNSLDSLESSKLDASVLSSNTSSIAEDNSKLPTGGAIYEYLVNTLKQYEPKQTRVAYTDDEIISMVAEGLQMPELRSGV